MHCGRFKGIVKVEEEFACWLIGENGGSPAGIAYWGQWYRSGIFSNPCDVTQEEIDIFNLLYPGWLNHLSIYKEGDIWVLGRRACEIGEDILKCIAENSRG